MKNVVSNLSGAASRFRISWCDFFFELFTIDRSEGERDRKLTSAPEISDEKTNNRNNASRPKNISVVTGLNDINAVFDILSGSKTSKLIIKMVNRRLSRSCQNRWLSVYFPMQESQTVMG